MLFFLRGVTLGVMGDDTLPQSSMVSIASNVHCQSEGSHGLMDDATRLYRVPSARENGCSNVCTQQVAQFEQLAFRLLVLPKEPSTIHLFKVLKLRRVNFVLAPFFF